MPQPPKFTSVDCLMVSILANTYFSGAGLMDIGLEAGGLTLQQSFEMDALCCDTLRRNFSHEVVRCDITKKLVQSEKECHVMVATYPCTKYSPITEDKRFPHGAHPYTVREYARLQGIPDDFNFAGGHNDAYRMIGNCVSVPVGKWIGSEIMRYFQ